MSVVRKSDFAKMRNVSQGRVSQWIKAGQISGAAIIGEGRSAMIDSKLALVQLQERLSINERFGLNGLNTKLDDVVGAPPPEELKAPILAGKGEPVVRVVPDGDVRPRTNPPAPEAREGEDTGSVDARLKFQKLEQNEILTRKLRTEERARDGLYMDAAKARGTMSRIASEMLKIFEGALPDMASAQAAKFQISQRESLHQMQADFRAIREQLAAVHAAAAPALPETVDDGDEGS
jgi:hypothetical protein